MRLSHILFVSALILVVSSLGSAQIIANGIDHHCLYETELSLSEATYYPDGRFTVDVANTGQADFEDVIKVRVGTSDRLILRQEVGALLAGESKTVTFTLKSDQKPVGVKATYAKCEDVTAEVYDTDIHIVPDTSSSDTSNTTDSLAGGGGASTNSSTQETASAQFHRLQEEEEQTTEDSGGAGGGVGVKSICNVVSVSVDEVTHNPQTGDISATVSNPGPISSTFETFAYSPAGGVRGRSEVKILSGETQTIHIDYDSKDSPQFVRVKSTQCNNVQDTVHDFETVPETTPAVSKPAPTHRIELNTGWNMISVPFDTDISEITDDCNLQTYKNHKVWSYINGGWDSSTALRNEQGYYVYSNTKCTATITGEAEPFGGLSLKTGWNMISADRPLSSLSGTCTFRPYMGERIWQLKGSDWIHPGSLSAVEGYFVNVANDCELGIPAPPIPEQ